ncbi:hypothetical protein BofuT4_P043560.1 [Botrytis cinerea T4]|uniref:Uncharacterized protein n=1 Tax=Botryotinia fuckeliana (strain T4) TaxID=999810 RepID=G2Y015_BOTF4|nr:hypothetical protein BofuT4_P043560.1 [Botrytis cinerea T4]
MIWRFTFEMPTQFARYHIQNSCERLSVDFANHHPSPCIYSPPVPPPQSYNCPSEILIKVK